MAGSIVRILACSALLLGSLANSQVVRGQASPFAGPQNYLLPYDAGSMGQTPFESTQPYGPYSNSEFGLGQGQFPAPGGFGGSGIGQGNQSQFSSDLLNRIALRDIPQRYHPQMFADTPSAPLKATIFDGRTATTDLPIAGGARRLKLAANNRAVPQDRLIFQYQLFSNALTADANQFVVQPNSRTIDLHQYTLGFEKTFADGLASIDVRMPFTNQLLLTTPNFAVEGDRIGNLNAKLKAILLGDAHYCFSLGCGFDVPTGSAIRFQGNGIPHLIENDAFFVQPFLAYEERLGNWFVNAFTGVDVALNGNSVRIDFIGQPDLGKINDQTLGNFSVGAGRWLCLNRTSEFASGLAVISELHYTTTLQDSDAVTFNQNLPGQVQQTVTISNPSNRSDHLNATFGAHVSLGNTSFRLAYVHPLRYGDDRIFDDEINFQLNRNF